METIAVFNTRGGSGKSAATVFLADFLSSSRKKRVLVVDLDPQQSSSVAILGEERVYEGMDSGKCLAILLAGILEKERVASDGRAFLMERPQGKGRGRSKYLGPVHVMAGNRQRWAALAERLGALAHRKERGIYGLLNKVLQSLNDDFDICLIDFPAHETGPITKNGLRASGWWVFPCVPDRSGIRDIEGPIGAFREACKGTKHEPKGLGTLLSICQDAHGSQFKQSEKGLQQLVSDGYLPRLFKNKLDSCPAARDALDDTRWDQRTTLKKKYAYRPLYNKALGLSKEVADRLEMPVRDGKIEFPPPGRLNKYLTGWTKLFRAKRGQQT